tara:strand:- start:5996 stop:6574 length:579 start_codon:yes stop_codon:yes gene_type:complete
MTTASLIKNIISPLTEEITGTPVVPFSQSSNSTSPVISEFSFTAGLFTADGKNISRGYYRGTLTYGTTTDTSFDLASGITIDLVNNSGVSPPLNFAGAAFTEYDPQSGSDILTFGLYAKGHSSGMPAFNDANYFKTLKLTNNTAGSTVSIARSGFSFGTPLSDGTDSYVALSKSQTIGIVNGNNYTVQLRSD